MKINLLKKHIIILVIALWLLSFFIPKPVNIKNSWTSDVLFSDGTLSFMVITGNTISKGITGYKVNVVNGNEVDITLYEQVFSLRDKYTYTNIILDLHRYDVKKIYIKDALGQKKQIWPPLKKIDPFDTPPTPP